MLASSSELRLLFAYTGAVTRTKAAGPGGLRYELSHRNRARAARFAAEMSYGQVPSIVYAENEDGEHGNFLFASYRRILQQPDWKARLAKVYTGSRFIPRKADRTRRELECATSSDALLMNIFCYPGVLRRAAICSLLGIEPGLRPAFGVRPGIPLKNGSQDRSEMDLKLGRLFIEAKLTEGDFQTARCDLVHRYRDLESVFDVARLPKSKERFRSCQLIRGALAAHRAWRMLCCFLRPAPSGSDRGLFRDYVGGGERGTAMPDERSYLARTGNGIAAESKDIPGGEIWH